MSNLWLIADATSTGPWPGVEAWGPSAILLVALAVVGRWLMVRNAGLVDTMIQQVIPLLTQVAQAVKDLLDSLSLTEQVNRLRVERDEWRDRALRAEASNETLRDELRRRP